MSTNYLISDAAKQVEVEAHVLRYWEEELQLPIKRNELGHRFYTEDDVERFREIKSMKERGLQLKAIRMILKNGKLDMLGMPDMPEKAGTPEKQNEPERQGGQEERKEAEQVGITENEIVSGTELERLSTESLSAESREDKAKRLQWLLQQLFRETLQENNKELCRMVKENILKELDYQFRVQEEKEDERYSDRVKREEEHYKKIDELLRKKRRLLRK